MSCLQGQAVCRGLIALACNLISGLSCILRQAHCPLHSHKASLDMSAAAPDNFFDVLIPRTLTGTTDEL